MNFNYNGLRHLLVDYGLTFKTLEPYMNCSYAVINKFMHDKPVSLEYIGMLCELFECQPHDIVTNQQFEYPNSDNFRYRVNHPNFKHIDYKPDDHGLDYSGFFDVLNEKRMIIFHCGKDSGVTDCCIYRMQMNEPISLKSALKYCEYFRCPLSDLIVYRHKDNDEYLSEKERRFKMHNRKVYTKEFDYRPFFHQLIDKGKTINTVVEETGMSRTTLQRMLNGENVKLSTLKELCIYLDCPLDQIVNVNMNKQPGTN